MGLEITAVTKVGSLLEEYPGIEDKLVEWVPAFVKLRNPVLRRTVAKVVTLDQAARIGGIGVTELVRRLREATGQAPEEASAPAPSESQAGAPPEWLDRSRVRHHIDANAMIDAGQHPLGRVQQCAADLQPGEMVRITSSFRPAPLIDVLRRTGLAVYSTETEPGRHVTYIGRP